MISVSLNGEQKELSEGITLLQLAEKLSLLNSRYAIEVNEEIVPRSEHSTFELQAGDTVEVVQAIGGG